MTTLDWTVMVGTIAVIIAWGVWKTRGARTMADYLKGGNDLRGLTIGLSVMATQASAITFLSTPGQAFDDGMRFVQFYFGLPIAMVVISAVMVPIYYRAKVYTAYEYLEARFDARVRAVTATLFLISRGLAAGITIYAPSIILSSLLGWSLNLTNLIMGLVVTLYTVSGGTKAVSQTQKQQMIVIMGGMLAAGAWIVWSLPQTVSLDAAGHIAGALGRMRVVDTELDFNNRYNLWSGLAGGFFLALAYFGTDQSQVQRYLSGRSAAESRLGLLFNGLAKVPMQFVILGIGVLLFVFYIFVPSPVFFNQPAWEQAKRTPRAPEIVALEDEFRVVHAQRREAALALAQAPQERELMKALQERHQAVEEVRTRAKNTVKAAVPTAETKDSDYIFLTFVMTHLPKGLVGLLIAVILSAAMSSVASELNALGSTTTVDLYKRFFRPDASERHDVIASRLWTAIWGLVALGFAMSASLFDNLIEAVNILGSIFYGTILGIFIVAFFFKKLRATPTLVGAVAAQGTVVTLFILTDIGFLWYNVIGCAVVVGVATIVQGLGVGVASGNASTPS